MSKLIIIYSIVSDARWSVGVAGSYEFIDVYGTYF